jgi:hypothetical protein
MRPPLPLQALLKGSLQPLLCDERLDFVCATCCRDYLVGSVHDVGAVGLLGVVCRACIQRPGGIPRAIFSDRTPASAEDRCTLCLNATAACGGLTAGTTRWRVRHVAPTHVTLCDKCMIAPGPLMLAAAQPIASLMCPERDLVQCRARPDLILYVGPAPVCYDYPIDPVGANWAMILSRLTYIGGPLHALVDLTSLQTWTHMDDVTPSALRGETTAWVPVGKMLPHGVLGCVAIKGRTSLYLGWPQINDTMDVHFASKRQRALASWVYCRGEGYEAHMTIDDYSSDDDDTNSNTNAGDTDHTIASDDSNSDNEENNLVQANDNAVENNHQNNNIGD